MRHAPLGMKTVSWLLEEEEEEEEGVRGGGGEGLLPPQFDVTVSVPEPLGSCRGAAPWVSASSPADDTRSAYIKGEAEAELKQFGPYYRRQFSVARFCQVEDELEQNKEKMTQLLRQKEAPQEAEVLYEEASFILTTPGSGGAVRGGVKEEFAPPLSGMPGQFLFTCGCRTGDSLPEEETCEVMANVVMEQLLPSLEKDMLPRLKAKKTEKKRVWFATVEAAYILVQEHLLEGLSALKEDCRASVRQQEVLIHSDMDQILESRRRLEEKVRAQVSEPAEKLCSESVQPYLGSVLEELMEPISSGSRRDAS
ncbi:hypothetical protein INR49_006997 [Caranx melampygus]|nr:hypothetical protein INR49_006997 [Caranx melampygus]